MASHTNDRPGFRPRPPTSAHNDALLLVQRVALHVVAAARELTELVFYGLRDGRVRCLTPPAATRPDTANPAA